VKAAKRIISDNTSKGSIDTVKFGRAILQYRNTPLPDLKLSPAQILFHRQLRDHIPSHPSHYSLHTDWIVSAQQRAKAYSERNHLIVQTYNSKSRPLSSLPVGTTVLIQNRGKKASQKMVPDWSNSRNAPQSTVLHTY